MDQDLRGLFERALDAEPVPPPEDLALAAMAHGTRLRRRRHLIGGGGAAAFVVGLATIVVLNVTAPTGDAVPSVAQAAIRPPVNPTCAAAAKRATDVSIFLRGDITDQQRVDLGAALKSSPLVRSVRYEGRDEAYVKFKQLWKENPELTESLTVEQFPAAFRVKLAQPAQYATFVAEFVGGRGIDDIVGHLCAETSKTEEGK